MNLQVVKENLSTKGMALAAHRWLQSVRDGNLSPLEAFIYGKAIEKIAKNIQEATYDEAINLAQMDKGESIFGVSYGTSSTGDKYQYNHDEQWVGLDAAVKEALDKRKRYESIMKSIKKPMVDPDTGVYIEPARIEKYGRTTMKVAFPK